MIPTGLGKNVFHLEGRLANFRNGYGNLISLTRKKRSQVVRICMTNGDDVFALVKPFCVGIACCDYKFLKSIMGNSENIPKKHDSSGVCFFEGEGLFSEEDLIHNVPDFKAFEPLTASG